MKALLHSQIVLLLQAAAVLLLMLAAAPCQAAGIAMAAAGTSHSVVLKADGSLWAWGDNTYGQLGIGTDGGKQSSSPKQVVGEWLFVAAGAYHTVAVKQNGSLWAWGRNQYGQLGDGTKDNRNVPVPIKIKDMENMDNGWIAVAAGSSHTVALQRDHTLWAWGSNKTYQLGDGTQTEQLQPVQIGKDSDWLAVAACSETSDNGYGDTVALKQNGTLWAWGYNDNFEFGNGTRTYSKTPIQIGTDKWQAISVGAKHTVALKDGSPWFWGNNGIEHRTPVQLSNDKDWQMVAAGGSHALALKGGRLWAWGSNEHGQLGDGTTKRKDSLVPVGTGKDWQTVAAGAGHTVAVKTNGEIWTWGNNKHGQLGDGQAGGGSNIPKQVKEQNTPPPPSHTWENCPYPFGGCPLNHPPIIVLPPIKPPPIEAEGHSAFNCPYTSGGCPLGHTPPPIEHAESECMHVYPCGGCPYNHNISGTIECLPRE